MRKFIVFIMLLTFPVIPCFADGNVVRVKPTGEIIYRQVPDFEGGNGIKNALIHHKEYKTEDLEEVKLSKSDFNSDIQKEIDKKKAKEDAKKLPVINKLKALGLNADEIEVLFN